MKPDFPEVDADGFPIRYQGEAYVSAFESGRSFFTFSNQGGTAKNVYQAFFVPLIHSNMEGDEEGFFVFKIKIEKGEQP